MKYPGDDGSDELMSKITFRADDDLVEQLEAFDASKSEVMREALREYLDGADTTGSAAASDTVDAASIDDLIAERVDAVIADRLDGAFTPRQPQDINVNIALESDSAGSVASDTEASDARAGGVSHSGESRKTTGETGENAADRGSRSCSKCGENVGSGHVYCPNCGEKASHRVFCDCGDELRSDWAFCPSCGRRTPAADVLDQT